MKKLSTLLKLSVFGLIVFLGNLNSVQAQVPITLTNCSSQAIISGTSPACNDGTYTNENRYYRTFKISDFVNTTSFIVDTVKFAVEAAASFNGYQNLTVNVYSLTGTSPTLTNMTLLNSLSGSIYDITEDWISAAVPTTISGSGTLVVEINSPDGAIDGHIFIIGSNSSPQTSPSYMYAPACSSISSNITNIATIQPSPSVSLLINVVGRYTPIPVTQPGSFVNPTNPVCDKNTITYSVPAVTGMTYNWTYSGTGVTITNSGSNSAALNFSAGATSGNLSVTATDGTTTSPARTLALTVNSTPVPTVSRGGNVLTASSGFASYQWYRNTLAITGATNSTYTMTQNGSYYVMATSSNNCSGSSLTYPIDDVSGVGIGDIELQSQIKMYPNPTRDMVTVESPIQLDATINRIDGRKVMIVKNVKNVDLKALSAGIYFITLTDRDGNFIKKEKLVKTN